MKNLFKAIKNVTGAILFAFILGFFPYTSEAAQLTVNVTNIHAIKGSLVVALYSSKKDYDSGKSLKHKIVKVTKEEHAVAFNDIPSSDYAVKLFHDDNDNKKLDKNLFGIPSEGYGFSNNGGAFGAPEFEKAKIIVTDNQHIEIRLQ